MRDTGTEEMVKATGTGVEDSSRGYWYRNRGFQYWILVKDTGTGLEANSTRYA